MLQFSLHVVVLVALCAEFTCRHCTKLVHFLTCTRIPCRDSHCENWLMKCCLYTSRRLQKNAVNCKRSNCNKIKNFESRTSEVLSKDGKQRVSPFHHVALHVSSFVDFHLNCHELHQESLHFHQLEEELDDWCQHWYFQNGAGLSCRSPDSWCRKCNVVNASLKSERSLNGPAFPELLREIHQFFLYWKYSACLKWWPKSFCASSSIQVQTASVRSCSSWDARNSRSPKKRSWIPFKMPLHASLSQIMGSFKVSLFFGLPISMATKSSFLNDIILNRKKFQCTLNGAYAGFTFFQEMPKCNKRCLDSSKQGILCTAS